MESPPDTVDGGLENAETILEDVLTRPASSFFQKVQSFMGRISRIDPWHRSRGTVDDETEVMIIAQKISKDIKALWDQRPALMDHAIACKLVPPLLSPSLANTLSRALMVCYANYHASFVHLHRVAYKSKQSPIRCRRMSKLTLPNRSPANTRPRNGSLRHPRSYRKLDAHTAQCRGYDDNELDRARF